MDCRRIRKIFSIERVHAPTVSPSKAAPAKPCKRAFDVNAEQTDRNEQEANSGSWSVDEHKRFLTAVQMYGNAWKKVQAFVATRSCVQIRSHSQKYFDGLRVKSIEEAKKSKENKLFAVYSLHRAFRNTTFDSNGAEKLDYDADEDSRNELEKSENRTGDVGDSEEAKEREEIDIDPSEGEVAFLDFTEPPEVNNSHFAPAKKYESDDEFIHPNGINETSLAQSLVASDKFENWNLLSDDYDADVKRKIVWYDDAALDSFEPTTMTKIYYDA
eukprot:TRINITY_DN6457_c0_g1_i4.p1 TRINITY_DN6457_c0_g1~~TRINITY_DN6457_c0_g1_i4.p1  ORF type:complete len:272 (+),score=55.61 TRINITY_DN6457_c0_g1_i4:124-939(+)